MSDNYLAHSKGPWKKHKYIKKVGNRYYYAGSKSYYNAVANDANSTESQKTAARRVVTRMNQKSNAKKYKTKKAIADAKFKVRNTAYKTGLAARGAAVRGAKSAAKSAKEAGFQTKIKARRAKMNISKATTKGMAAIKRLMDPAVLKAKQKKRVLKSKYLAKSARYKKNINQAVDAATLKAKQKKRVLKSKAMAKSARYKKEANQALTRAKVKTEQKYALTKGRIKDTFKGKQTTKNLKKIRSNVEKAKKKHSGSKNK